VILVLHHQRRVRRRWKPPLEVLTLVSTSSIVKKEVPWVKLFWTVDPLKEKALLMVLHKKIQKNYE
jgi:hypothetical protein